MLQVIVYYRGRRTQLALHGEAHVQMSSDELGCIDTTHSTHAMQKCRSERMLDHVQKAGVQKTASATSRQHVNSMDTINTNR